MSASVHEGAGGESDLAALRMLAEQGRDRPLLGGREFVVFGLAIALASAIHGAIVADWLPLPPASLAIVWFVVIGGAVFATRMTRAGKTAIGVANRVEWEVWRAGGWVLGVLAIGILAHAMLTGVEGYRLFALMPPVTFGVYAIALAASSAAARADYLRPYAALSVVFLALTVMLASTVWLYWTAAVGALVVSVLPGLALLRRERAHG